MIDRSSSPLGRHAVRTLLRFWALACLFGGCASWSHTRTELVDPIHAFLHHRYPEALETVDRDAVAALFASEREPGAIAPSLELLSRFREIRDARAGVETVDLTRRPVPARLSLAVDGVGLDGRPKTVRQTKDVELVHESDGWKIVADRPGPIREVPVPGVRFVDDAQLRGLWFKHESRLIEDLHGEPQRFVYGSGVAATDIDADGWVDVLLLSGDRIRLFANRAGSFVEVSKAWGLGEPLAGVLTVALPFDYDNDGRKDLFVGTERAQPLLLHNEGDYFRRVEASGIATTERTIGAVAADFDNDGLLDLFLANHEDVFHNAPDPPGGADNAQPDQLYLNNGDGSFRDATARAGVGNTGWSLAPVAADYDLDGDIDLFVGNDFGTDALYRNDGTARFEEVSATAGVDLPIASMSADWGDFDGDGDFDLFVGGMRSGSAWVLETPGFRVQRVPWLIDAMFRPFVREAIRSWFRGNRFYENQGDGTFVDIAADSGAQDGGWAWGSVWFDFDNDGRLDVYGANGFISGADEHDI